MDRLVLSQRVGERRRGRLGSAAAPVGFETCLRGCSFGFLAFGTEIPELLLDALPFGRLIGEGLAPARLRGE